MSYDSLHQIAFRVIDGIVLCYMVGFFGIYVTKSLIKYAKKKD